MEVLELVSKLLNIITALLRAKTPKEQEDAMMAAQEAIKAELDRRKFGG